MIVTVFGAKIFEGALTILAIPRVCHFKDMISYKKSKRKGMFFSAKMSENGYLCTFEAFSQIFSTPTYKIRGEP